MKRLLLVLMTFTLAQPAFAGPFTNKLSICLVKQTNPADKELLIQWVFAAMASHPNVKHLSNVNQQQGEELNRKAANLFTDLVANRCKQETQEAIKYENELALRASFETLGKVAMQGIMSNPSVNGYMGGLQKYFDIDKLNEVFKDQQ